MSAGGDDMAEGQSGAVRPCALAVGGALILAGAGAGVAGAFAPAHQVWPGLGAPRLARSLGLLPLSGWTGLYQRRETRAAALRARDDVLDALRRRPG